MFFMHLRDLSFIWPFREANTRSKISNYNYYQYSPTFGLYTVSYAVHSTTQLHRLRRVLQQSDFCC